uniref:HNH endonuclease n=1 Tax=uncultured marine group II/III euryarchaeote AD1000_66_E09 TaxID=1457798 RepID=A0A075G0W9_9EURY|nr:HNH endonuclease [uncultured marine group II/III euryarchaeote AD1000_66_E09]
MLQTAILVLNQNYEPLNICNARRAVVLLQRDKTETIEEGGKIIQTVMSIVSIPSVIRMVYFVKRPRPITRLSRREVFNRDGYKCQYCGCANRDLTLNHVIPRSRGGTHSWENLTSACKDCNHSKDERTPNEARMRLYSKPHRPHSSLINFLHCTSNITLHGVFSSLELTWKIRLHYK